MPTPPSNPSVSGLIGRYPAFEKIRSGERLQIGSNGPVVVAIQGILLLWNYPLTPADVTGQFDEKTAQAILHYRIDLGLTEIPARGTFDAVAREQGVFDAAALEQFQNRMEAAYYREIQAIDSARGVLFHVPLSLQDERALGVGFQHYLQVLEKKPHVVSRDAPEHDARLKATGKRAAWVPLNEYACVAASRYKDACSP